MKAGWPIGKPVKGSPGLLVPVPMSLLLAQSLRHAFPSYHPAGKCGAQQGIRAGPDAAPDSVASVTGSGMDVRTTRACKMRLDFAGLLEESALRGPPGTAGGHPTTSTMGAQSIWFVGPEDIRVPGSGHT